MLEVRLAGYATGPAKGTPVVFLHGFPFNRHLWDGQQEAVASAGYRVILPDLRGHGQTPSTPEPATMPRMAGDVFRLLDRLETPKAILVGHSMGGYVALQMVAEAPDRVLGLVLTNTRAEADDADGRRARDEMAERIFEEGIDVVVDALLPKLLSRATREGRPGIDQHARRMMAATPPEGAVNAVLGMRDRADRRALLPTIGVPTLVVSGADDPITPPDVGSAMAAAVPEATYRVVDGTAHLTMVEDPDAFNRVLLEWLRRAF